jgi:predicted HTH domain antitoxin
MTLTIWSQYPIIQPKKESQPMAKTTVEIPDERLAELEAYKEKLGELLLLGLSQVKIHEALLLYKRGLVSLGRAAELSGISERDMIRQARAVGIEPAWSASQVEEELA